METESFRDRPKIGLSKTATNVESAFNVLLDVIANPKQFLCQTATRRDMYTASIQRVLKCEKFHSYKIDLQQELSEIDFSRRMEFCNLMSHMANVIPIFNEFLISTDEFIFFLNVYANPKIIDFGLIVNCTGWIKCIFSINSSYITDNLNVRKKIFYLYFDSYFKKTKIFR